MAESFDPTVPLADSFKTTIQYNGRDYQYHALRYNVYFSPIDEDEIDRLQAAHTALKRAFDYRNIFPPVNNPKKILDCGFGTGIWAAEVAEQYPTCEVIGVDISPHMALEYNLPNLDLQVDDLNQRFTFHRNEFDLVRSQMVAGGINKDNWKNYIKDIHRVLKPGGWCQMVEVYFQAQSDNGSLTENHALRQWSKKYIQAIEEFKNPRIGGQLENMLKHEGFKDVECQVLQLPLCGWPTNPRMNEIGRLNRTNVQRELASNAMYLFTERLGMTSQEAEVLIAQARVEADNPALKPYFPLYVCIGRKRR